MGKVGKRVGAAWAILALIIGITGRDTTNKPSSSNTTESANVTSAAVNSPKPEAVSSSQTATTDQQGVSASATDVNTTQNAQRIQAKVLEVVDGDTVKIKLNDKEETVRFLLVDTLETKHPKYGVQPFGKEASDFTKQLLTEKTVELEQDVNNGPDKYGRFLYYVYVEGKSVQEQLLEKRLARVAYIYAPNVKYVDQYKAIQEKAQKEGLGIWSVENYAQEDGYHPDVIKKNEPASTKAQTTVSKPKENTQPAPVTTPQPVQEVYYANCSEAKAAGAAPLYRGEPGYRAKLDRDKDGFACEKSDLSLLI
ncbi:thermonuclease family protein [Brevibacillus parabrevis]|uniref:thermonuclease family protein n=1 Tax=Brevibacillus parabrevis TaxID=54914 RepID=UPI001E2FD274|nr:thermonuclease family protein [Brevibacillus parabrevis]